MAKFREKLGIIITVVLFCTLMGLTVYVSIDVMKSNKQQSLENLDAERKEALAEAGYDNCVLYGNNMFSSNGKLYTYAFDRNGEFHVFFLNDVEENNK